MKKTVILFTLNPCLCINDKNQPAGLTFDLLAKADRVYLNSYAVNTADV